MHRVKNPNSDCPRISVSTADLEPNDGDMLTDKVRGLPVRLGLGVHCINPNPAGTRISVSTAELEPNDGDMLKDKGLPVRVGSTYVCMARRFWNHFTS